MRPAAGTPASPAGLPVAQERDLARQQGYPPTTEWLMALSGEPASTCRSKASVGEALEQMPGTREAFAAGELPESRAKVLAQAQAPAPEQFAEQEATLVAQVAAAPPQQVPKVLAARKRSIDPQAAETEAERLHQMRALHISRHWSGMVHVSSDLDPAGGLAVLGALRSLSEPAGLDPHDARAPPQARANALVEIYQRFLQGDGKGKRRPAGILVTIPWGTLAAGKGIVDTDAGPVGGNTARRLACDATIRRVLLDPEPVPIKMGRAARRGARPPAQTPRVAG